MLRKPKKTNTRDYDGYREFRLAVLRRDKYQCQMPDCTCKRNLQVHHITRHADSHSGRLNVDNAITLCYTHHSQIKNYEGHYKTLFFEIINRKRANGNNS